MAIEQIQFKPIHTTLPTTFTLADDDEMVNEDHTEFTGTAITTGYNRYNYGFSLASIKSLLAQCKKTADQNGTPLQVMHTTYGVQGLPIGRTLDGKIRKRSDLEILAYIDHDVPVPDTNSIIRRMDKGTIDSLSISWDLTDKSYFKCDVCGEKMDKGYFMPYDSKGHYPGKKLEDGTIVTATVHGPIRFRELSIVGTGADPRAKMLEDSEYQNAFREEFNELSIQSHDIPLIAELSGWDAGMFSQSLSFFDMKKGATSMATPETPETPETPSAAAGEWKVLYEQAQERITELEAAQDGLITLDDHQAQVSNLREKLDEETQARELAESEAKENEYYAKIGVVSVELDRERAVRAFKAYKGGKVENPVDQAKLKQLQESTDLKWLRKEADEYWDLADEHKNTRAAEEERMPRQPKQILRGVEANI